jgi:hypothetical protein
MAALAISDNPDGRRVVALSGRLDGAALKGLWAPVRKAVDDAAARPVTVDAAAIDYLDGAGAALFGTRESRRSRSPTCGRHTTPCCVSSTRGDSSATSTRSRRARR